MASRHLARAARACATQTRPAMPSPDTMPPFVARVPVGSASQAPEASRSWELPLPVAAQAHGRPDASTMMTEEMFAESSTRHPLESSYTKLPSPPFRRDDGQLEAIRILKPIYDKLMLPLKVSAPPVQKHQNPPAASGGGGFFSLFSGSKPKAQAAPKPKVVKPHLPAEAKGLYIYGTPGTGKTVVLDLFYRSLPADFPARRLHWHEFIGQGMRQLGSFKKESASDDLYEKLAASLVPHCRLLLLDELLITHISEAMFVKQLFRALWARGTVVITTSNYKPDELYAGGFNRSEFEPFIPNLKEMCPLLDLDSPFDYRTMGVEPTGCFLTPISEATTAMFQAQFDNFVSQPVPAEILVEGRPIQVPACGAGKQGGQVARFHFNDLCGKPRGRAEFAALATKFDTIFIDEIPRLNADQGAEFVRLVSLIDVLYDKKCLLHCTSELPMHEIWDMPENTNNVDEMWAWRRTKGKLAEMASEKYAKVAGLMRQHLVQVRATEL